MISKSFSSSSTSPSSLSESETACLLSTIFIFSFNTSVRTTFQWMYLPSTLLRHFSELWYLRFSVPPPFSFRAENQLDPKEYFGIFFPVSVVTVCSVPLSAVCNSEIYHNNDFLLWLLSNQLGGYYFTERFFFGDFSVIVWSLGSRFLTVV